MQATHDILNHGVATAESISGFDHHAFPGRFIAFATNHSLFINFFLRSPQSSLISFFDHLTLH
jgi:hypothetical protein